MDERKKNGMNQAKREGFFMDMINMITLGENVCCGEIENSVQERQDYRALKVRQRSLSLIE